MDSKAQSSLEYLMTYGWALVLVAILVVLLVFVLIPKSDTSFFSSDPTKILLQGSVVSSDSAKIKLQNITGGQITVTGISWGNCKVNDSGVPLEVIAGGEMLVDCEDLTQEELAEGIVLTYDDFSGLSHSATISASSGSSGGPSGGTTEPPEDPGAGTLEDPFKISTPEKLQAIEDNLNGYYVLTGNINASETSSWNGGKGFESIGTDAEPFTGSLDGQGYTISGLYVNSTDMSGGLINFGLINNNEGEIKNLGLTNVDITLIGAGGITAALVGQNKFGGTVTNCFSTGRVSGYSFVGGLVGSNLGTVINSYSECSVAGNLFVGGLVGTNMGGTVVNSYSTGSVAGTSYVGGLIGNNMGGTVIYSYSTGPVSGTSSVGGFIGSGGTCLSCYWDKETSGQTASSDCGLGAVGKTTAQMQTQSTFTGWDFATVWQSPMSGYPALRQ